MLDDQEEFADDTADEESSLMLTVDDGGERVDRWLADRLPGRSRSEVQRWINEGLVTLEDRPLRSSYRVSGGETILVRIPPVSEYHVEPEPIPLEILYEDEDLLVINKPAGMVVHPAAGNWQGTLVNAVLHHDPNIKGVGGTGRPGIVHRLDKDTSGLILVAKNDMAQRSLQEQFRARTVTKTYLALAFGQLSPKQGEIRAPIGRDPRQRKRMAVVPLHLGREAVTQYEVLAYYGDHSFVRCHPLTGRTHQIRVHLAYAKHPVVGDTVYAGRRKCPVRCPRQFLHAHHIRFRLPSTDATVEFEAPLPADLQSVLNALSPV